MTTASHKDRPSRLVSLPALIVESTKPIDWLVDGLIPRGETILMSGTSQSGKTYTGLDLGLAVSYGAPWLGQYLVPEARPVIYAPSEGRSGIGRRVRAAVEYHYPYAPMAAFHLFEPRLNLIEGDSLKWLVEDTIDTEAALVIVDVLRDATPGVDENSAAMGDAFGRLRDAAHYTGATFLVLHHLGKDKSKGSRGHSSLKDKTDIEIIVSGSPVIGGDGRIVKTAIRLSTFAPAGKNRNHEPWEVTLDLAQPEGLEAPVVLGEWVAPEGEYRQLARLDVLQVMAGLDADRQLVVNPDGWTYAEIAAALDMSKQGTINLLETFADKDLCSIDKSGKTHRVALTEAGRRLAVNFVNSSSTDRQAPGQIVNNPPHPTGAGELTKPTVVEELLEVARQDAEAEVEVEESGEMPSNVVELLFGGGR